MRDDERYPIPTSPHTPTPWEDFDSDASLPQVAAARHHDGRRDKYLVHPYETVGLHSSSSESRRPPPSEKRRRKSPTILGLRKRVFWTMAGVITTLVTVGVVVGAVIGSSTTAGNTNSTMTSLNSSMSASNRQIGAATMNITGSTATNIQVVYQDLTTTDLLYRLVWDDAAGAEQRISSLNPPPQQTTPIAVTTTNTTANDEIITNVFYLSTNQDNSSLSDICQVTLRCSLGAENCTVSASGIISDRASMGVLSDSGLSATLLPESSNILVYYKNGGEAVQVLAGNGTATDSWEDSRIGSLAFPGSGISANYDQNKDILEVIFVNSDSKEFEEFAYSDTAGIGTNTASTVTSSAPSGWTPTAEFSTCFQPGLKQHHIYYVDSTGDIHGIFRGESNSSWTSTQTPNTGTPIGGIASVGWDSQVRLLYMAGDPLTLSMSVNNNSQWSSVQAL